MTPAKQTIAGEEYAMQRNMTCWVPGLGDVNPGDRIKVDGIGRLSGAYYVQKIEPKRGGFELTLSSRMPKTVTHVFG